MSNHTLSLLCSDSVCVPPFHSLEEGRGEGGGKEEGGRRRVVGGKGGNRERIRGEEGEEGRRGRVC